MMRAMFSAISGLHVHQTMLDVAANDISNVNTVGFKGQSTSFKDALSELQRSASAPSASLGGTNAIQVGLGVQLDSTENEMGAGAIQQTGNPLDLAIQGEGWFRVMHGGTVAYTRAGNFGLDSAGNLVTQDGDKVLGAGTTPITIPAGSTSVSIGSDGTVTYTNGGTTGTVGPIELATFQNESGLKRISSNLFEATSNSGTENPGAPGDPTVGTGTLAVGSLEMSNVDLASEFTTMITAQRGYEANGRVITVADQMLQDLVNLGR